VIESFHQLASKIRAFMSESISSVPRAGQEDNLATLFNKLALDLFEFQFQHNPAYQKFCQRRAVSPGISHYGEIPAISASAFKELELSVFPSSLRTTIFHSSGTTQQKRGRHFHSPDSLALYEDSLICWLKPFVLPERDKMRMLILTPRRESAPNSSLVHMFETVDRHFALEPKYVGIQSNLGWDIDYPAAMEVLRHVQKSGEPVLICGTAFSFVHLCDKLGTSGWELPSGSRIFETGGYKGRSRALPREELHEWISKTFQVNRSMIISEYGMSELSSQAYDQIAGSDAPREFQFPPWTRIQFISPETMLPVQTGESGLIRIFDLANAGSVMALQTEDLGHTGAFGFELQGRAALAESRGCSLMSLE
jgi:hypothetical protein